MGCSKHELYGTRNMLYSQKNEIGFRRLTFFTSYFIDGRVSLRKQPSLLPPRHLRRFARRNVCDSATEIPYWWRNQCLHNISGSHGDGVPNTNLFNFTFLLVDFGKVLCPSTTPAKLKCFMYRRLYSTNVDCFVKDSSRLHLSFVAFCLLPVIRKQEIKQSNYSIVQSALMTGFRREFTSPVWNFWRWVADVPARERSLPSAAKSEGKRLFSQTTVEYSSGYLLFISFLGSKIVVNMARHGINHRTS